MPYYQVGDAKLYYESRGSGSPLVLLHGMGSSLRDWYAQVGHFVKSHRVIRLDLRGHGRSSKEPMAYSIPGMAREVVALLDHLDLENAHIVGLSMGGMVALQLALDYPGRVRTVTAVNCDVDYRLNSVRNWAIYLLRYLVVRWLGPRMMARILAPILLPDPQHAELRETFIERYSQNDRDVLLSCINAIAGWSIVDDLGRIPHPTLVVAAEHDYSSVAEKLAWAPKIPQARVVVIPGTHHAVPVEQPALFNAQLESFLELQSHPSEVKAKVRAQN